ncbi:MAG: UDP-N-acetylmuramate dehydrogenase [Clostridia bacterium]|nr:UDP-N-acetylmuramate dehydrogenase [Clostridia bacterium]
MSDEIVTRLINITGKDNVRINEPMKNHTTFKIGGPAQYYVTPESVNQIQEVVSLCRNINIPLHVIGNGSNILVGDDGVDGVVLALFNTFSDYEIKDNVITAQAGMSLIKLAVIALREGLTGLEFASGIPGSVGGAVYMNAGAYDGQMKDVVTSVTVLDEAGNIRILGRDELDMGYRTSAVAKNNMIVLQVVIELKSGDKEQIKARMNQLSELRKQKQPLEYPSAGSTFKRPEGYFAGKLIADAGLKGYSIGGAAVSEKHAGFVVNMGGATAKDVVELTDYIKKRIMEQFGVTLELEVKRIGL